MRVLVPVLLVACLVVGGAAVADDGPVCAACHEDVVKAFERTGHAIAPGWDPATGCESCHGSGEAHIEAGGDPELIVRPRLLPAREASDGCLSCHQRQEGQFAARHALHRLEDVGCLDCHGVHSTAEKLLARQGVPLCGECHQGVAARFELPRSHPLGDGACASCHDPHAGSAFRSGRYSGDQACETCHFEKSGPFLYAHDTSLVDGCLSCHEVHGSANRHMLRHETQVNLCYECHSASTTPGWHSAPRFLNEKCTACHAAIHGSNTSQFFLEE